MRLLLDTNRYNDLMIRDREVVERFSRATEVWLSVVTIGELRSGFIRGTKPQENEDRLKELLQVRGVQILSIDEETAYYYGQTHAFLKESRVTPPINDVWIAAQAIQHNLVLDTRDADFDPIPGLRLADR